MSARRIGSECLTLALRLAAGAAPPPGPLLVPPRGVVPRRSTDALAIADAEVAAAVAFIRGRACDGIGVDDVLQHVLTSRSTLDRRMKRCLGHTASDEISRVRLQHARRLVEETDLPLTDISSRCGYAYLSHFSHAFRQAFGHPPSVHRGRTRALLSGPLPPVAQRSTR